MVEPCENLRRATPTVERETGLGDAAFRRHAGAASFAALLELLPGRWVGSSRPSDEAATGARFVERLDIARDPRRDLVRIERIADDPAIDETERPRACWECCFLSATGDGALRLVSASAAGRIEQHSGRVLIGRASSLLIEFQAPSGPEPFARGPFSWLLQPTRLLLSLPASRAADPRRLAELERAR